MSRGRDFMVGVVFFGLLIVLGVFTTILADFRFGSAPTTTVAFDRVDGLTEGAQVWVNGVKSGSVSRVHRDPKANKVLVDLEFDEDPKLNSRATFRIESVSLLGGKVVTISNPTPEPGESAASLDLSKRHEGENPSDMLAEFRQTARKLNGILDENRKHVADAITNIDQASATIRRVVTDREDRLKETVDDLADAMKSAKGILAENREPLKNAIAGLEGVAGELTREGPALLADLRAAAAGIREVTRKVNEGDGVLATLLNDPKVADDLKGAIADIREFTGKAKESKGTLGRLMNDPALYDEAVATVKSLRASADRIEAALGPNAKNNVVGLLLTDEEMAKNLKNSVAEISRFIENQRENAPLTTFAGLLFSPF